MMHLTSTQNHKAKLLVLWSRQKWQHLVYFWDLKVCILRSTNFLFCVTQTIMYSKLRFCTFVSVGSVEQGVPRTRWSVGCSHPPRKEKHGHVQDLHRWPGPRVQEEELEERWDLQDQHLEGTQEHQRQLQLSKAMPCTNSFISHLLEKLAGPAPATCGLGPPTPLPREQGRHQWRTRSFPGRRRGIRNTTWRPSHGAPVPGPWTVHTWWDRTALSRQDRRAGRNDGLSPMPHLRHAPRGRLTWCSPSMEASKPVVKTRSGSRISTRATRRTACKAYWLATVVTPCSIKGGPRLP